jgi:hypothetical protein
MGVTDAQHNILCGDCLSRDFIKRDGGNQRENRLLVGFYLPGKPCYVVHTGVMQSLHKNEKSLLKDSGSSKRKQELLPIQAIANSDTPEVSAILADMFCISKLLEHPEIQGK